MDDRTTLLNLLRQVLAAAPKDLTLKLTLQARVYRANGYAWFNDAARLRPVAWDLFDALCGDLPFGSEPEDALHKMALHEGKTREEILADGWI